MPHTDAAAARETALELPAPPTETELLIGRLTAVAVGGLAEAVQEWQRDGNAEPGTKKAMGDRIAELVMLRAATAGEIVDFEAAARTYGLQLLQQHCGDHASADLLALLIDDVLRIVAKVCATQWH
jgi:hypothetical protein